MWLPAKKKKKKETEEAMQAEQIGAQGCHTAELGRLCSDHRWDS